MVCYKHRNLLRAHWALLAGFVPLVVAIVYYLRVLDSQLNPPNLLVFSSGSKSSLYLQWHSAYVTLPVLGSRYIVFN